MSGIGFIGAGAIIKGRAEVHGLATAVSLWITVSVGIAASYRLFALAAVLSGTTLVALRLLKPLKRHPEQADKGRQAGRIPLTGSRRSKGVADPESDEVHVVAEARQTGGRAPRRNASRSLRAPHGAWPATERGPHPGFRRIVRDCRRREPGAR